MTMANRTDLAAYNTHAPVEGIGSAINANKNLLKCVYDFDVLGGAVGTVHLKDDQGNEALLPDGAVVTRAFIASVTDPTSGGLATVALKMLSAGDILAALAFDSITGLVECIQDGTAAKMIGPCTADSGTPIQMSIAVAALTAGKFDVFLEYVIL